jgi:hypothetical protein
MKILVGFFIENATVAPAHRTALVKQNQIGRIRRLVGTAA